MWLDWRRFSAVVLAVALLVLLMGVMTNAWSQSNDSNLKNSEETSLAWARLYNNTQNELNSLRENLKRALNEATTSKLSLARSTDLYNSSLMKIKSLETFSYQIATRMQERDLELAQSYNDLDAKEKELLKKDSVILRLVITIIALSLFIIASIALAVAKLYFKVQIPFIGGK